LIYKSIGKILIFLPKDSTSKPQNMGKGSIFLFQSLPNWGTASFFGAGVSPLGEVHFILARSFPQAGKCILFWRGEFPKWGSAFYFGFILSQKLIK